MKRHRIAMVAIIPIEEADSANKELGASNPALAGMFSRTAGPQGGPATHAFAEGTVRPALMATIKRIVAKHRGTIVAKGPRPDIAQCGLTQAKVHPTMRSVLAAARLNPIANNKPIPATPRQPSGL